METKLNYTCRHSLVNDSRQKRHFTDSCESSTLKRVIKHLWKERRKKRKLKRGNCGTEESSETKLRCRQLPNLVLELRKAALRHDWHQLATLLTVLCYPGLKYYTTIILRVCFILLFNHPKSNSVLLENFIRLTTDYILMEDVRKFVRIVMALRKTSLSPLESGKYVRKSGDFKVVREPQFEIFSASS